MSGFGKFLAVLNFLAAGAFAALVVLYYHERDVKADHALTRASTIIEGDPVTKPPAAADSLLPVVQGAPVPTQEEEVRKVQGQLQAKIDQDGPVLLKDHKLETKLQKLAWALRPFSTSFGRREALNRLIGDHDPDPNKFLTMFDPETEAAMKKLPDRKARLDALTEQLQKELTDAFNPKVGEKRMVIAHALFCAAEALGAEQSGEAGTPATGLALYDKAVSVVGLEIGVRELEDEANTLQAMRLEAGYTIDRDREAFLQEHTVLLAQATALADELKGAQNLVQSKEGELDSAEKDLKQQQANKERIENERADIQRKVKGLLTAQAEREKEVFQKQTELRDAVEQNRSLELILRELEAKVRAKEEGR